MIENLLTAEAYAHRSSDDCISELVCGRIKSYAFPYSRHGQVCSTVNCVFSNYARRLGLGFVLLKHGIITRRDPDSVRGPDVSFYSHERLTHDRIGEHWLEVMPNVIVEVRSHDDSEPAMREKIEEYLDANVRVVCVLDPTYSNIQLHRADGDIEILSATQTLRLPELSDSFAEPVSKFFE